MCAHENDRYVFDLCCLLENCIESVVALSCISFEISLTFVRSFTLVSLTCETYINQPTDGRPVTRDDITCKIIYCSTSKWRLSDNFFILRSHSDEKNNVCNFAAVNPGGWAPASVLRAL